MTATVTANAHTPERVFRLSDVVRAPVLFGEERIGRLSDLIIVDRDVVAEVTHICVQRPFGRPPWFVPWAEIAQFSEKQVIVKPGIPTDTLEREPAGAVLLEDYIVDKKVLDVEGREIEVVYDVSLALKGTRLYVVGVDISRRGLLRRIGLKWLANLTAGITDRIENDMIGWGLVEPLPAGIDSFAGDLKLKVVKRELAKIPPIDVARILEQLGRDERLAIFNTMEPGPASDALEALDPKSQRELISALPSEKAGNLINAMTPGQAADVLAVLPWSDVYRILAVLDRDKADQVRKILAEQDQRVKNYVSSDYLKLRPETTVAQARQLLRGAQEREAVAYLYVLDAKDHLLGLVNAVDLLAASDDTPVRNILKGSPSYLNVEATLKDTREMFARYDFRALPVVDRHGKMKGVVLSRDVMGLKHAGL